ncbi:MAG: S-layer homology domain-containing protein, partial [Acidobacteriota bacterium]
VNSGPTSTNATTFTVAPDINVLDVAATADTAAEEGTGNLVGMRLTSPSGTSFSTAIEYPVIGSNKRQIVVDNPEAGQWTIEIRGARGLTAAQQVSSPVQAAAPGPVDGTVNQVRYILPVIADINGNPNQAAIEAAIKNRYVDVYADGLFRPSSLVNREDLVRSLMLNTSLRQTIGATAKFSDISGDLLNLAEASTAKGSTLRDYDFVPTGMVSFSGGTFQSSSLINRLDLAVAQVKALGHDAKAKALAGSSVTVGGMTLTDNNQIPSSLRGYVQIAINNGIFEAFPAEIRQVGPGQFIAVPGPRFEPMANINRGDLAVRLNTYRGLFAIGG